MGVYTCVATLCFKCVPYFFLARRSRNCFLYCNVWGKALHSTPSSSNLVSTSPRQRGGDPGINGCKAEVVKLCWCPASGLGADVLDFVVVAPRLHIQCPPGQYESETLCLPCPGNHYCPGGCAMLSCPIGSTALVGSSPLLSGTWWKHVHATGNTHPECL